jgi:hypothetical protein
MKVNNYPVKTPAAGDRLFGSDSNGDQKQFDMSAVSNNVFQYEIGEYAADQGGVIFHRYLDGDTQNYLVVAITDQSTGQAWSNVASLIGSSAQSTWNGLSNSNAIIGQSGFTSGIVSTCLNYSINSVDDWYLPSFDELYLVFNNRFNINRTLSGNSSYGSISGATQISYATYWSSTELDATSAWIVQFQYSTGASFSKTGGTGGYARAVRKFSI